MHQAHRRVIEEATGVGLVKGGYIVNPGFFIGVGGDL